MGTFLRYLMAFAVQLAWQRAGKTGATPPMRMPFGKNKNKAMPLPIIGPWQMMIAMWLARQVWTIYGQQVKTKLKNVNHPVADHIGNLLPDAGSTPGQTYNVPAQPVTATPAPSTPPPAPSRPAPQYGTQPLDSPVNGAANGSGDLPPGTILNSLRKAS